MATTSNKDDKPGQGKDTLKDAGKGIDGPRLTPQGRTGEGASGQDETSPEGGAKQGQPSKAEG